MSLCFDSPLGHIDFSDAVIETFNRHRQMRPWSREAGGQLFCRMDGNGVFVEYATEPKRSDKRSRFSFWPHRKQEQQDINTFFASGLHYIGDWHTHPEDAPSPSREDIDKMRAIFKESDHVLAGMLLVVVGRQQASSGMWCGLINRDEPRQLKQL